MKLMKKEFGDLQNRLDQFSQQFDEVKRKIDWSAVQVTFYQYEQKIRSMTEILKRVENVNENNLEEFKTVFMRNYENNFFGAPHMLATAIINKETVFSTNLIEAARHYTENHRYYVQDFMVGLTQLIMEGMQIEASYIQLKYGSKEFLDYMQSFWDTKLGTLKEVMEQADRGIQEMWYQQLHVDVESFAQKNVQMTNQQFSSSLYYYLRDKYRWREWFVITYNPISGWNDHATSSCESRHQLRVAGRNILATSVEIGRSTWGQGVRDNELRDIQSKEGNSFRGNDFALQLLQRFGHTECSHIKAIAVIAWGAGVWYIGNSNHVAYSKVCIKHCPDPACWFPKYPCYNVFKFG